MHRFDRMHLSPEAALRTAETLDLEEKSRLADGLAVLAVIDHRRDYLAAGYSCTLDFCVDRLHMSQDQALKRIQVARVALQFPSVFECLADGRLSVSTASVLAPHLQPETAEDLLAAAACKPRQEVLRLLAERGRATTPTPVPPESMSLVPDTSGSYAPGHMNSLPQLLEPPMSGAAMASPAPAQVTPTRRGRVSVTSTGGHEVRLALTDDEHADLRRAQDLLGHAVPSGDPALVYARAMQHYVAHLEKRRFGAKRKAAAADAPGEGSCAPRHVNELRAGRGITKALRQLVWERDGGRCAFVGSGGHRCAATRRLEIDHITPLAKGGRTTPENLRLLCRAHNQFEAERLLGKSHVQHRRELAARERARSRLAATAEAQRAKAAGLAARGEGQRVDTPIEVLAQPDAQPVQAAAGAAAPATSAQGHAIAGLVASQAEASARAVTLQQRHDDLVAALRGLGFQVAEAVHGAELAESMPDASLETCLRHALTVLTRPTALRGERRARCTA